MKQKPTDELIMELGVILDQIKACRRGLKDHPNDEVFKAAVPYMINEGMKIKSQIEKQLSHDNKTNPLPAT